MVSKKWWEQDEAEKAKKKERKERERFISQDITWEAQLILDKCDAFKLSLENDITRLRELLAYQEQEIDQEFQDLEES